MQLIVKEMQKYYETFQNIRNAGMEERSERGGEAKRRRTDPDSEAPSLDTELKSFWLRKTRKPVLSVLMVQKPDSDPVFYHGINMEASGGAPAGACRCPPPS